jgi:hypothetical protein
LSRRVSLPAADDLFRPTAPAPQGQRAPEAVPDTDVSVESEAEQGTGPDDSRHRPARRASGRVRHDEKMTVYVTAEELLDLEHARLMLRRHHGLAVDRGRLVRAAVALALADLEEHGEDSALVQRLRQP